MFENIFDDFYDTSFPLRLIGVAASKVIESKDEIKQLSIFDSLDEEQKDVEIDNLIKNINNDLMLVSSNYPVTVALKTLIENKQINNLNNNISF